MLVHTSSFLLLTTLCAFEHMPHRQSPEAFARRRGSRRRPPSAPESAPSLAQPVGSKLPCAQPPALSHFPELPCLQPPINTALPSVQPCTPELPSRQPPNPIHYFPVMLTLEEVKEVHEFISHLIGRRCQVPTARPRLSELLSEQPTHPGSNDTELREEQQPTTICNDLLIAQPSMLEASELPLPQVVQHTLGDALLSTPTRLQCFDIGCDMEPEDETSLDADRWLEPLPPVPAFPSFDSALHEESIKDKLPADASRDAPFGLPLLHGFVPPCRFERRGECSHGFRCRDSHLRSFTKDNIDNEIARLRGSAGHFQHNTMTNEGAECTMTVRRNAFDAYLKPPSDASFVATSDTETSAFTSISSTTEPLFEASSIFPAGRAPV